MIGCRRKKSMRRQKFITQRSSAAAVWSSAVIGATLIAFCCSSVSAAQPPLGKDTAPLLRSNPANDRISVVQETYESTLIMAEGYNRKLLKSEADMLEELQQAIGEALPYRHESCPSHREENGALPAT
jgi:hypothetical protein